MLRLIESLLFIFLSHTVALDPVANKRPHRVGDCDTRCVLEAIRKYTWQTHQYFDVYTDSLATYIDAYNAIPDSLLANYDTLKVEAKVMIAEMTGLIEKVIDIKKVVVNVIFFDRNSEQYTTTFSSTCSFKDGVRVEFSETGNNEEKIADRDYVKEVIAKLHQIKLSPSQYLTPYFKGPTPDGKYMPLAVCLVTLMDTLPKSEMIPESRRQFGWIAKQLRTCTTLRGIWIKYMDRFDPDNKIVHTYDAPKW